MSSAAAKFGDILRFHKFLLADTGERLALFEQAIRASVHPGDVVLDLGAGTGVLACFAAFAGASRVHAIERAAVVPIGRAVVKENGFDAQVLFTDDPDALSDPVNVIVMDMFNTCGLQAGAIATLIPLRDRCLVTGGTILPERVSLDAAFVELPSMYEDLVDFWNVARSGLRMSSLRRVAANHHHPVRIEPTAFLGPPASLWDVPLTTVTSTAAEGEARVTATRSGVMHGVCAWFSAPLAAGLVLTNAPGASNTNYAQAFFPLLEPLSVEAGDRLFLRLESADAHQWNWAVERERKDGTRARSQQSTALGVPFEGLRRPVSSL